MGCVAQVNEIMGVVWRFITKRRKIAYGLETLDLFQQFQSRNEAIYDWTDVQFDTLIEMMHIIEFKEYETLINVGEEASWFGFLLKGAMRS